jgi:drug/metabolite transporter (DMT)-like permease
VKSSRGLALVAVAVAVLTWGCSNVAVKLVSTTGVVASFYRLWLSIPLLWLYAAAAPTVRARLDGDWLRGSIIGGLLFSLHQILFFNSLKLTSVANVALIGSLQPALVLLAGGRLFGESVTPRAVAWSAAALLGTAVVIAGSHGSPSWSPFGDVVAVANLLSFTAYFLVSKQVRSRVGAVEYVIGMTTVAGLVLLVVCVGTAQSLSSPRGWDWAILLGISLFPGTLGHLLTNWAHPHLPVFVISIMLLGVPLVACAGAALVLGEWLAPAQIAGGAVVLIAMAAIVLGSHGKAAEELAESAAETDAP